MGNLIDEIDFKNQNMDRMQINYKANITLLSRKLEEKDKHHKTFCEGLFISHFVLFSSEVLWCTAGV